MKSISSRPQFCAATKVAGRIGNDSTSKEEIPDQSCQQIKNPTFRYKENSFSHFSSNSAICEGRLIFQKHLLCAYPGRKHALKRLFIWLNLRRVYQSFLWGLYWNSHCPLNHLGKYSFIPKKRARIGTEPHRHGVKSWLYCTIMVIFNKVFTYLTLLL